MEKSILNVYKPVGISPLGAIDILRKKFPEYADLRITYAGRLDPMASGVLILLAGDAVHKLDEHIKLDKEYEAEILFGFNTDTYDILGILRTPHHGEALSISPENIEKELRNLEGEIFLPFPPYSSYKIKGKPLFMWAREGKLNEIEIPIQATKIYSAKLLDTYEIRANNLLIKVTEKINKVKGDFRQKDTLKKWQENLNSDKERKYLVAKVKFNVSSGTYIRSIANYLGQTRGGAVLLSLLRIKVGDFDVIDSIKLTN